MQGDTFTPETINNPPAAEPAAPVEKAPEAPAAENKTTEPAGAEPAAPADNAAPDDKTAEQGAEEKVPTGVQSSIDEITRARREAEREAEYWKNKALQQPEQNQPESKTQQPDQLPPGLPAKPVFDERYNGDYDSYVEDLAAWRFNKEQLTRETTESQRKEQETYQATVQAHTQRVEAARASIADYDSVVSESDIRIHNDVVKEIIQSDLSAQLVYHLAKNPETAQRLNSMTIPQQIKEIGRLEERLTPREAPPVQRISKAPEPINPVGNRESGTVKDPDKMTTEEWMQYERQRINDIRSAQSRRRY